jgi:hypothetical protein
VGLSNGSTLYVNLKLGLEGFLCPEIKKVKNENKKTTATTAITAATNAAAAAAAMAATTTATTTTLAMVVVVVMVVVMMDSPVERVTVKNAPGLLKPVPEMVKEICCNDISLSMVLTHSKLLETWRATAKLGQREARQILAEMLKTPSGGTKANCYKFISMVTGRSV